MSLAKPLNIAMRGLQFLWALLVMAIVGNMVAEAHNSPSVVNYSLFCSVFGMLSLFYLLPATIWENFSISPWFPLILDILNTIFWFCGAVALAADLGVHSCSNQGYLDSNHITNGVKTGKSGRCTEAQASDAFLFFGFFAFLVSTVLSGLNTRGSGIRPSGIRRN